MKRFIALFLAFISLAVLTACPADDAQSSSVNESGTSSQQEETLPESITAANKLIEEGKYAEAYAVLYADRDNEDVKAMLEDFKVYHTRTDGITYDTYRYTTEETYNEYGNVIERKQDGSNDLYDSVKLYEYTYDEDGNVLTEKYWYSDREDVCYETKYTYDENGNQIKAEKDGITITYTYDENGNLLKTVEESEDYIETLVSTYDENGNELTSVHSYKTPEKSGTYSSVKNTYDNENRLIKRESIRESGDIDVVEYEYNDRGDKTKEINTTKYLSKAEPFEYSYEKNMEYTYDDMDRIVKIITADSRYGTDKTTEEFFYENGDLVKKITVYASDGSHCVTEYKYTYNDEGVPEKKTEIFSRYHEAYMIETYDEKGNLTYQDSHTYKNNRFKKYTLTYDDNGVVIGKIIEDDEGKKDTYSYIYDEKGNVSKETYITPKGSESYVEYTYDYTVDEKGKVVKKTETDIYGLITVTEYTYDEKGNETNWKEIDPDGRVEELSYIFTYNEKGQWTEKKAFKDGKLSQIGQRTYNERGDVATYATLSADGVLSSTMVYEYDQQGNLVKMESIPSKEVSASAYKYLRILTYDDLGNILTEHNENYGFIQDYTYSDYIYFYQPS